MTGLVRAIHLLWVLGLAATIVLPALPAAALGGLPSTVGAWLRTISVSQHWGMYAPNPQRAHAEMNLVAHYHDGSSEELEETAVERRSWGTHWAFTKRRTDIWRYHANVNPKKANRNRTWYLRSACVREARRTGRTPDRIVMTQVRRRFAEPSAVAEGAPDLGEPERVEIQTEDCDLGTTRRMIEEDRGSTP